MRILTKKDKDFLLNTCGFLNSEKNLMKILELSNNFVQRLSSLNYVEWTVSKYFFRAEHNWLLLPPWRGLAVVSSLFEWLFLVRDFWAAFGHLRGLQTLWIRSKPAKIINFKNLIWTFDEKLLHHLKQGVNIIFINKYKKSWIFNMNYLSLRIKKLYLHAVGRAFLSIIFNFSRRSLTQRWLNFSEAIFNEIVQYLTPRAWE